MEKASEASHSSSDQMNFYSAADRSKDMGRSSLNDISITQIEADQIRRQFSEITSPQNILPSFGFGTQEWCERYTFEPKEIVPKKNRSLLGRPIAKQHSVEFICFQGKRVTLWNSEIEQFISKKRSSEFEVLMKCQEIVEEVIRRLCISQYNFQPLRIRVQTFNLETFRPGTNSKQNINSFPIDSLFQIERVLLSRVVRKNEGNGPMSEYEKKKKEGQILQILSPDLQDIVECIDKNKTVAHLKSQIASNYYQIIGEMILISYSQFKLIQNSIKIFELPEKVIEIYQKQVKYIDPAFIKQQSFNIQTSKKRYEIMKEDTNTGQMEDIFVNESGLYGQLKLKIKENQLIQSYSGGIVGYVKGDRKRVLPLITLTGIKVTKLTLSLSFQQKNGEEIFSYTFSQEDPMKFVLTNILTITRYYNHHIESFS